MGYILITVSTSPSSDFFPIHLRMCHRSSQTLPTFSVRNADFVMFLPLTWVVHSWAMAITEKKGPTRIHRLAETPSFMLYRSPTKLYLIFQSITVCPASPGKIRL
eukprot:jgi/Botrbrau1/3125/Bobra.0070s0098.1